MRIYVVKKGDSLWTISRKFNVPLRELIIANGLDTSAGLVVGQTIVIPGPTKNYGYMEVNGFIQPSTAERETRVLSPVVKYLTYVSPFSYHVNADGTLTPLRDDTIIKIGTDNKTAPLLSISNISGANFDTKLISEILNNNSLQETLINNILNTIKAKKYYGVIIDFERIPPKDREKYNNFLRKVVNKLHPNYTVATALAPKLYDVLEGAWHGAHDYKAHGQIVDFVIIMTYEWGWSGGPPMAVAPIDMVQKVINYAVSVIPPKKIMMGVPLYGYDWTLPYTPGGEFAESIGNQEAIDRARKFGATIKYNEKAQSPYYNYIDNKGNSHEVWFEDARSVEAKYKLASRYGLRGVSYWALGKPFQQNWTVLDSMFKIVKVIK